MPENTKVNEKQKSLVGLSRDGYSSRRKSPLSLRNILLDDSSHLDVSETMSREDTSVSFFPGVPDDIEETSTEVSPNRNRFAFDDVVPPVVDGHEGGAVRCMVVVDVVVDGVPDSSGKRTILAEVGSCFVGR
jgi:hypothetical protein